MLNSPHIENDIPIPSTIRFRKYYWCDMKVGDSILFRNDFLKARNACHVYARRNNMKFATRKEKDGGGRVWRIE